MQDEDVLAWAVSEQRILLTTDKDFEEMIWLENRSHAGVLRLENLPRQERKILLKEALQKFGQDLESGAVVIALKNKFRLRRP